MGGVRPGEVEGEDGPLVLEMTRRRLSSPPQGCGWRFHSADGNPIISAQGGQTWRIAELHRKHSL